MLGIKAAGKGIKAAIKEHGKSIKAAGKSIKAVGKSMEHVGQLFCLTFFLYAVMAFAPHKLVVWIIICTPIIAALITGLILIVPAVPTVVWIIISTPMLSFCGVNAHFQNGQAE